MRAFLVFLWIIAIIIYIFVRYWIAKQFYEVANLKGYYEKKYLWIPFMFFAGYLLIIALPSKNVSVVNKTKKVVEDLPEL